MVENEIKYIGKTVPQVTFKTRVRDDSIEGPNPFRWEDKTTNDYFANKRVVVFSLPGAFTPICSTYQVPEYDENYDKIRSLGVDEVYCVSVNDAFVMNKWAQDQKLNNLKLIPDGSGEFTKNMDMLVCKDNLCFGYRSWRYSMVVNNGKIEAIFVEPGKRDNAEDDPYVVTDPQTMIEYLSK